MLAVVVVVVVVAFVVGMVVVAVAALVAAVVVEVLERADIEGNLTIKYKCTQLSIRFIIASAPK